MRYFPVYGGKDLMSDLALSPVEVMIEAVTKIALNVVILGLNLLILFAIQTMNLIISLAKIARKGLCRLVNDGREMKKPDTRKCQASKQVSFDYICLQQNL